MKPRPIANWNKCQKKEKKFWRQFKDRRIALLAHADFFELIYRCFCKTLHDRWFKRALEIGIGASGGFLAVLPKIYQKHGVDTLIDWLGKEKLLPFKNKIKYKQANAEDLPYEDSFFSLVIIANAIDHCENMEKVMEEIKRVLAPKGLLLLMTYLKVENPHPYTFGNPGEVRKLVNMKVIEEHLVDNNPRYRGRNDYYVGIFQK